jgi:predicted outer membrane repeat protein
MLGHFAVKVTIPVIAGLMAVVNAWPGQAWAVSVAVSVPCNATDLANDINAAASGATLNLAPGCVYRLTAGLPTVGQDLTITGSGATLMRSPAAGTPQFAILQADAGTLTVDDVNFTNGNPAISAYNEANLTVSGGAFTGNSAADGGAISAATGAGNLSVTGATFTGNSATDAGGAINTSEASGTTTVSNDRFTGNSATNAGGAIYDFNVTGAQISGSRFTGNQSAYGGAIVDNSLSGETLNGVAALSNSASADGGGLYSLYVSTSVTNSTFVGNQAGMLGGGLYQGFLNYSLTGMTMTGSAVLGNSAQSGGGIYSQDQTLQLSGSAIRGNNATADGGGIYNDGQADGYDTVTMGTSNVSHNSARGNGGGVYNIGELDASSSWIVHNTAASDGGGIYNGPGGFNSVSLTSSGVLQNRPDNCAPPGSVTACSTPRALWHGGRPVRRPWICHPARVAGRYCCPARHGSVRVCPPHLRAPMVTEGHHHPRGTAVSRAV